MFAENLSGIRAKKMVLEGRLELPWVAPLAPQASASAISPPEHIRLVCYYYTSVIMIVKSISDKKVKKDSRCAKISAVLFFWGRG